MAARPDLSGQKRWRGARAILDDAASKGVECRGKDRDEYPAPLVLHDSERHAVLLERKISMSAKSGYGMTVFQRQHALAEAGRLHGSERFPVGDGVARGAAPQPGYRVLVIDPSLTVRTILRVCLGRAGFLVFDFPDGVEALRWLRSPQVMPIDVTLVDTDTPKID